MDGSHHAGLDVGLELVDDGVQVTPEDEIVDDAVAAAGDLLLGVAQPAELGDVVLGVQVRMQMLAGDRAGLVGVGLEQHRVLGGQERVRPEGLARLGGVRHVDVVGLRTGGAFAGQLEHLGAVGSHDAARRSPGQGVGRLGRVHLVEVRGHGCQGLDLHPLPRPVTESQTEHVAVGVGVGEQEAGAVGPPGPA